MVGFTHMTLSQEIEKDSTYFIYSINFYLTFIYTGNLIEKQGLILKGELFQTNIQYNNNVL